MKQKLLNYYDFFVETLFLIELFILSGLIILGGYAMLHKLTQTLGFI